MAERGVRHGRLAVVPVEIARDAHAHGAGAHPHDHYRVRQAG
jgi:CopG family nickel-responsive transcriptional regulator